MSAGPSRHPEPAGLLAVHLAVLLMGMASLFGKWIAVSGWMIAFGRLVFATPTLGAALLWQRRGLRPPPGRWWGVLVANGAVLAVHWSTFFHAIQISTVAIGLLGYVSATVFAVLLEPLWFRERFVPSSLAAAALIVAGMGLIVPEWRWESAVLRGLLWGLVSGLTFAVLQLNNRLMVRSLGSTTLAFFLDATALALMAPAVALAWETPGAADVALMAVQGVVLTAFAHTLFIWGLHAVQAHVATIVGSLEPIYGIALAALLLGEIPSLRTVAGGALILAAVAWVSLHRARAARAR